eukprot:2121668-Amphidinium_carterae.1
MPTRMRSCSLRKIRTKGHPRPKCRLRTSITSTAKAAIDPKQGTSILHNAQKVTRHGRGLV